MPETPIETTAVVRDRHGPHTWQVGLPNGKIIVAHLPRHLAHLAPQIRPESRVILQMTPYDFEKGRSARLAHHG
jgi:translation initiation factor IF-1